MANRTDLSDLRGAARLAIDATTGVVGITEKMHRTIQQQPGPLGRPVSDRPGGIAGIVYRSVRGSVRLVGHGIDACLAPVEGLLTGGDTTPAREAYRSAVNGLFGDHLVRTANPLAIDMSLRFQGRPVDAEHPTTLSASRLLVLVHGLCMNDQLWNRNEHDHGMTLADDLGYQPLYLRYNSGLAIADNGRKFAELLERLVGKRSAPVQELVIIGHSMGGLVARSASHYGQAAGHTWPKYLRKLVFLGTPHHGAPLERGGHGLDVVMDLSPYLAPFTRIGKARSAGITDLRHGTVVDGEKTVPLPAGVNCYVAAATRATSRSGLGERLGDGLVPVDSALGRHRDANRALNIPENRQWTGYQMGHLDLLNHAEVYARIHTWLQQAD